jgi:hypothetical protein
MVASGLRVAASTTLAVPSSSLPTAATTWPEGSAAVATGYGSWPTSTLAGVLPSSGIRVSRRPRWKGCWVTSKGSVTKSQRPLGSAETPPAYRPSGRLRTVPSEGGVAAVKESTSPSLAPAA